MLGPYKWSTINGFHWSYMEEVKSGGERARSKIWNNREVQDPMGQHSRDRNGCSGSSPGRNSMAMLRGAHPAGRIEQIRQMDRMPLLRTTPSLRACNQCPGSDNPCRPASERDVGSGAASIYYSRPQRDQGPDGEGSPKTKQPLKGWMVGRQSFPFEMSPGQ